MSRSTSTFDIDGRLRAIASRQLGLVAFHQAAKCGIDKHALARRRDSGSLIPVYSEVMRIASVPASPSQRALAASLAVRGSVVASTSANRARDAGAASRDVGSA